MSTLRAQDLKVETFEVAPAAASAEADTEQVECWSPLCGPTEGRTCPDDCVATQAEA